MNHFASFPPIHSSITTGHAFSHLFLPGGVAHGRDGARFFWIARWLIQTRTWRIPRGEHLRGLGRGPGWIKPLGGSFCLFVSFLRNNPSSLELLSCKPSIFPIQNPRLTNLADVDPMFPPRLIRPLSMNQSLWLAPLLANCTTVPVFVCESLLKEMG